MEATLTSQEPNPRTDSDVSPSGIGTPSESPALPTIDAWVAQRNPFRVVANGPSIPLPLSQALCSADVAAIYEDHGVESKTQTNP